MRLGVLAADSTLMVTGPLPPTQDPNIVPGQSMSGGYTSGPSSSGDTLMCPPGYPYDYVIHDCHGYAGSPADVAAQTQQAGYDACASGGGTWDPTLSRCVMPGSGQWITGIPNGALYVAGAILALTLFMGKR